MSSDEAIIRQRRRAVGASKRRSLQEANKLIDPEEAARLILDGDTLAIGGFVGMAVPEALLIALADRFDQTGGPRDLTLVFTAAQGDGRARGLNRLAREGLSGARSGRTGGSSRLSAAGAGGTIEAYCLPLGVVSQRRRPTDPRGLLAGRRSSTRRGRHDNHDRMKGQR